MSRSVVCATQWVPYRVCQLVLNEVGSETQHLVQHRSRHSPKAVPRYGVAVKAQVTQCCVDRVLAHGSLRAPDAREDELANLGPAVTDIQSRLREVSAVLCAGQA